MALFRPMQDFTTPSLGEEFYRAVVVDNNDPNKLRRVKIRIQDLHGTDQDIPDSELPWAIQFRPTLLGGDNELSLTAIPRVGADLIVTHIRGDIYQPAYVFELSHNTNKMVQEGEEDYPDSYVLKDSDENYWHVNLVQDKLDIKFNGNECIEITVDRNTTIGQDDTETVGRDQTKNVIRDHSENIGRDKTKTVQGNESNNIDGTRTTSVVGNESTTINGSQTTTIDGDRTENLNSNTNEIVANTKTVTAATFNITCSGDCNINASNINLNGNSAGVLTQESINPLTGTNFPSGSSTVKAGDGNLG